MDRDLRAAGLPVPRRSRGSRLRQLDRVFDAVDLWTGPPTHNDRYRKLKEQQQEEQKKPSAQPAATGDGLTLIIPSPGSLALGLRIQL